MNSEPNNLSDILKQLRIDRGVSLREFSELLGISHAYLNKLERGEDSRTGKPITPTIETLVKIAEGLNIPTKKFMDMCGYFNSGLSAREPIQRNRINIDTEISALIALIASGTNVTIGDTQINESTKESVCQNLRETLIKLRKDYDTDK